MASPVSDDVACFDSLPDDLVGVIMSKLNFWNAFRLTQACPTARRLVQGERAVPGVFGTVYVHVDAPHAFDELDSRVAVWVMGFRVCEVEATTDGEDHAERQPSACLVHLCEWICMRARAFTEIEIDFESSSGVAVHDHIASTFLPNVPSSFRGKISFCCRPDEAEWEHLPIFLAAWRALAPAYECGLTLVCRDVPSDQVLASLYAAPPLSSLNIFPADEEFNALLPSRFLESLDTSRLTTLDVSYFTLESLLPSQDVLSPTLLDHVSLCIDVQCWSSLDAFLAPLHRLTDLHLNLYDMHTDSSNGRLDSPLTLAPFTVLPNLRMLYFYAHRSLVPPAMGNSYWKEDIVLPALETLNLSLYHIDDLGAPEGEGPLSAGQPSRWPTLLSNLEAPKLERLWYNDSVGVFGCNRTLDLPLGRFPRLRFFYVSAKALLNLPALRAEIATLRHLQWPPDEAGSSISAIFPNPVVIPEEEVTAWELELGFRIRLPTQTRDDGSGDRTEEVWSIEIEMCSPEDWSQG